MSFGSIPYFVLLLATIAIHRAVAGNRTMRTAVLAAASWAFYALASGPFVALLVGVTAADWLLLRAADRASPRRRRLLLATAVTLDLGTLAAFKYAAFLVSSVTSGLAAMGLDVAPAAIDLGRPLGVSFFVFSSLTCTIDVWRNLCPTPRSFLDHAVFVAFFPKVMAGPIARARQFLPQLDLAPRVTDADAGRGMFLILAGLVKKIAIADFLGRNIVDRVFDAPQRYSSLEALAGVYGYTFQIYCDFSGLTDIAIGSALLLGFALPLNFDLPYRATNLRDFWRRWHVSLSTWLRDYLYVPLGGSRRGPARTYVALMITMLLGGLWHGAAWTFVAWGALHGAGLAVTRAFQRARSRGRAAARRSAFGTFLAGLATFHFVAFAWIFFRAPTFDAARAVIARIAEGTTYAPNLTPTVLGVLGAAALLHYLPRGWTARLREAFVRAPAPAQAVLALAIALGLSRTATTVLPFIYRRF